MSGDGCVHGCNHPLWGGRSGTCLPEQAGYECYCGDGYVSEDSLGRPSCVSKLALTCAYGLVGLVSGLALVFFLRKANSYRLLPEPARETRRARLLKRLIAVTSFYSGSALIVFVNAAAHAGTAPLHASGMLQALYTTSIPAVILAAANISEIWVNTLPTQVMPPTSAAARWKGVIEERNILAWAGVTGMACCIPFGVATWFSLDTLKYVKAVNLITGLSAILAIICFNLVAISLTRIINRVGKTRETADQDFYHRALKKMWAQVLALSATAVVWTVSLATLELFEIGRRTPVIFIALMVTDANVGFSLAVHFCKVNVVTTNSPAASRLVV